MTEEKLSPLYVANMDNGRHRSFIRREGDVVLGVDGEVVILASYEFHFIRVILLHTLCLFICSS